MSGRRSPVRYAEQTQAQTQRIEVMDRDGWACRFEVAVAGLMPGETHHAGQRVIWEGEAAWVRCGATARVQTAHLFRRHKLSETLTDDGIPLKWHPLVAVAGCDRHHRLFDMRGDRDTIRPPAVAVQAAKMLIAHTHAAARERGEFIVDVDLTEFDPA